MRTAAFELFAVHGFVDVTVGEIAEAAGVTERTFFRHFPTKEDVLFSNGQHIVDDLVVAIRKAQNNATGSELLLTAITHLASNFESDRAHHRLRAEIIGSNPALHERELLKQHHIAQALVEELVGRAIPRHRATVLAGVGMVVFQVAYREWTLDRAKTTLASRIERAMTDVVTDLGT